MKVVALAGGVGGAKMVDGLAMVLRPEELTVVVNTGDDFEHFGLRISPDLDTVCYTLAGLANPETGWGRRGETWNVLAEIKKLGGATWFRLGDLDLATHLERTRRLKMGDSLSQITRDFCRFWDIGPTILPMSDEFVPTKVITDIGNLNFQEYFVQKKFEPTVKGFEFENMENARPAEGVLEAIEISDMVVLCPSNPWVSIKPILSLPGIVDLLAKKYVVGVSPIIGGKAVKGPAAKMFRELGFKPSSFSVVKLYKKFLDGFVVDFIDQEEAKAIEAMGIKTLVTNTIMKNRNDRMKLAKEVIRFF